MKTFRILLTVLLLVGTVSCSRDRHPQIVVRIGLPGQPALGPKAATGLFRIAEQEGFIAKAFGNEPVKLDYTHVAGNGVALNEALASNQLDLATYGGLPNIIGLAGGNTSHIVFMARAVGDFYLGVKPNARFHRPEDLKGARIAIQKGNISHHLLVLWLKAHGLTDKDVTFVNLAIPDGLAAFAAGQVDAVWGAANILEMQDKGELRIIGSTGDGKGDYSDISLAGTAVSNQFEQQHPDVLARLIKVMVQSAWWASQPQNREAVLKIEADSDGFPLNDLEREFPGPLKARFNPVIDGKVAQGFQKIIDFASDQKLIRQRPSLNGWFATKYQQDALRALNLENYWTPAGDPPVPPSYLARGS
jgi:sulfonate transport system substrate-binding protein